MEYTDKAAYRTLTNKLSTFRDSSLDPKTLADELQERNDIGKTAYEHAQNPKHEKSERRRELIVAVMGNGRVGVFQDLVESLLLMQGFDWLGRELKGRCMYYDSLIKLLCLFVLVCFSYINDMK